jgi:Na+-translocating ferredoxin:NAD+ oxidoreductase RnfD subunit
LLPSNTANWEPADAASSWLPTFFRTPKGQLLAIFGLLLVLAAPAEGGLSLAPNLIAAIAAACAIDLAFGYWESRRWISPTSALLSGLIVAFILGAQEPWQVVAWVAGFASVSKHIIATHREHIFNPAALALLLSVIVFGSGQSWWGALGNLPLIFSIVLLVGGIFVVERLNKFALVLTFLGVYFSAFALASLLDASSVAEMFRPPFVESALFLAFFMLTDPATSPNRLTDQVWFAAIAALVAFASQLLGAGQVFLLLGVLAANVWLAVRRWWLRRPVPLSAPERRRARRAAIARGRASSLR